MNQIIHPTYNQGLLLFLLSYRSKFFRYGVEREQDLIEELEALGTQDLEDNELAGQLRELVVTHFPDTTSRKRLMARRRSFKHAFTSANVKMMRVSEATHELIERFKELAGYASVDEFLADALADFAADEDLLQDMAWDEQFVWPVRLDKTAPRHEGEKLLNDIIEQLPESHREIVKRYLGTISE